MIPLKAFLSAAVTTRSAIQIEESTPLISVPLGVVAPVVPLTDICVLLESHTVWKVPSYLESVALFAKATSIIYFVLGRRRWNGRPLLISLTVTLAPPAAG